MTSLTEFNKLEQAINSRETYLAYRKEWKSVYKNLSEEIRAQKRQRKVGSDTERSEVQSKLYWNRLRASLMMQNLDRAKEKRPIRSNLSDAA